MTKMLNSKLKLLPGKGYSFNIEKSAHMPQIPSILCEGKVAVTPLNDRIRFGGTMEITHVKDRKINMNRVKGIVETCNRFYPELNVKLPKEKEFEDTLLRDRIIVPRLGPKMNCYNHVC